MSDTDDWTIGPDGRSNTSEQFESLCVEVERLIRSDAHMLIGGRAYMTARLIMAQLAHEHGLRPPPVRPDPIPILPPTIITKGQEAGHPLQARVHPNA